MKYLLSILSISILLSGEMEVDGDLKVTGTVESTTIDSLKAVIAELQAQLAALQAQGGLETRLFELPPINFNAYEDYLLQLNIDEITGESSLTNAQVSIYDINSFSLQNQAGNGAQTMFFLEILSPYENMDYSTANINEVTLYQNGIYRIEGGSHTFFTNQYIQLRLNFPDSANSGSVNLTLAVTAQFPN